MGIVEGDIIYNKFDMYQNLLSLIKDFNKNYARKLGKPRISLDVIAEGADN